MTLYSIEVPNRLSTEYGGHSPQKQSLSNKIIIKVFWKLKQAPKFQNAKILDRATTLNTPYA